MVAQTVLGGIRGLRRADRVEQNARTTRTRERNGTTRTRVEKKQKSDGASARRTVVRGNARVRSEDGENDDDNYFDGDRTKKEEGGGEEEEEEEEEEDPFEGLEPREIAALVAKEAPDGDVYAGWSPEEIQEYEEKRKKEREKEKKGVFVMPPNVAAKR